MRVCVFIKLHTTAQSGSVILRVRFPPVRNQELLAENPARYFFHCVYVCAYVSGGDGGGGAGGGTRCFLHKPRHACGDKEYN